MSLVALAHLYVVQTRRDVQHHVPDLTLDMAIRLLHAALPRPQLKRGEGDDFCELKTWLLSGSLTDMVRSWTRSSSIASC
ncbi:MAG: hypothetical protein PHO07_02715 [Pirellulales bacterium]|jgi:hypothetical protein|nr:hypothetical protein [Thermoguttaceae bacterium]MDD4786060.1 hypothetical protein [Pirellulales bacterium]MDI9446979.1 hypothetical protein [Planctomycetota bacterium]NLZ00491.1 hypothetical protein [Pirellulaceae bacterium]